MFIQEKIELVMNEKIKNLLLKYLGYYDLKKLRHPTDDNWCPYIKFSDNLDEVLFVELVEISSYIRATIDSSDAEFIEDIKNRKVGELVEDITVGKSDILTLRKCCNKIIHAKKVKLILDKTDKHPGTSIGPDYDLAEKNIYKYPTLNILGKKYKKKWEATVNVVGFLGLSGSIFN